MLTDAALADLADFDKLYARDGQPIDPAGAIAATLLYRRFTRTPRNGN